MRTLSCVEIQAVSGGATATASTATSPNLLQKFAGVLVAPFAALFLAAIYSADGGSNFGSTYSNMLQNIFSNIKDGSFFQKP
jgi:hypothetical protein